MNRENLKKHLPTIPAYIAKKRAARRNQLPKHLRPPAVWPLTVQIFLNSGLIITLYNMMVDREEYMTEAAPAVKIVICLMLLIYTFIQAFRLRRRYNGIAGNKRSKINMGLMLIAFAFWMGTILVFLT